MSGKRLGKNDIIFLSAVALLLLAAAAASSFFFRQEGAFVRVTVDGEEYGVYPLGEPRRVLIKSDGGENLLVIGGGSADMEEASCPDGICVRHRPIKRSGESIICLPNRVVAEVVGPAEEGEFDSIAK